MRTDDPAILAQIEQLETACEALRRICGFPPRFPTPETTASRTPKWCPHCNSGFDSTADLQHHLASEHA